MITVILTALILTVFLQVGKFMERLTVDGQGQSKALQQVSLAQGHKDSPEARARFPNFFCNIFKLIA